MCIRDRLRGVLDRAFAGEDAFTRRDIAIDDQIERFAVLGAALTAAALPPACEGIDLWNDTRLARTIGAFYGHQGGQAHDARYFKTLVSNVIGSAGSWFAVSLLARLVPASSRVANAYASTYALGKVTKMYFEKSEAVETDVLRAAFKEAKKEGLTVAKEARAKIEAKRAEIDQLKATLDSELDAKKIDADTYMTKLVALD